MDASVKAILLLLLAALGIPGWLQPERDPALTDNEPETIPQSSCAVFEMYDGLLAEAAGYFGEHHQVFDVIRDEGEVSSGFFASDMDAAAIRRALGDTGVEIIRRLNEKACLRSVAYYTQTKSHVPALLFNFVTQASANDLLIYIYPVVPADDQANKAENIIALLSKNHGALIPLSTPGWYYIESYSWRHAD